MWTKRELVAEALNELALAGLTFDTTPEEQAQGIRTLDRMMAGWTTRAISIGYLQPATAGQSDPDDDAGISDAHADAVVQNLALRLCGSYGKQAPLDLRLTAKASYDALLIAPAQPVPQPLPAGVPLGAGNKSRGGWQPVFTTGCASPAAPCGEPDECCEPGLSFTAGAAITQWQPVAVLGSGLAVPADCMTLAHADVVAGLAMADAAAQAVVRVQSEGEASGPWEFTPGQPVFVGIGGALVQTVPAGAAYALQIGAAITPTRVLINIQPPVVL